MFEVNLETSILYGSPAPKAELTTSIRKVPLKVGLMPSASQQCILHCFVAAGPIHGMPDRKRFETALRNLNYFCSSFF
jgi:hypothetical protein